MKAKTKGADASHHKSCGCLVLRRHGHRFSFQQLELWAISDDKRVKEKTGIIFFKASSLLYRYHVREPEYLKRSMIWSFTNRTIFQFINSEHRWTDHTGDRSFSTDVVWINTVLWTSANHGPLDYENPNVVKCQKRVQRFNCSSCVCVVQKTSSSLLPASLHFSTLQIHTETRNVVGSENTQRNIQSNPYIIPMQKPELWINSLKL